MARRQRLERFTEAAKQTLTLAQVEAENLHHQYIGPEHLLMGLLLNQDSLSGRILVECGLSENRLRSIIQELTVAYPQSQETNDLTQATKKVLESAVDEARREGMHYISTYHLLLGVVRQTKGIIPEIFKQIQLKPEDVYAFTRHEAKQYKNRFGFKRYLSSKAIKE